MVVAVRRRFALADAQMVSQRSSQVLHHTRGVSCRQAVAPPTSRHSGLAKANRANLQAGCHFLLPPSNFYPVLRKFTKQHVQSDKGQLQFLPWAHGSKARALLRRGKRHGSGAARCFEPQGRPRNAQVVKVASASWGGSKQGEVEPATSRRMVLKGRSM